MNSKVPATDGIPDISPVDLFRLRPGGSPPDEISHVIGAVPVAVSVRLYAVPTVPFANVCVETVGATAASTITIDIPTPIWPQSFRTCSIKLKFPAVVGVPDIKPVAVFRVRPGGSAPDVMLHVIGAVPLAVGVRLYGVPTVPPGSVWKSSLAPVGAAVIMMVSSTPIWPQAFSTRSIKRNVPAVVGVPDISPVAVFRVRPDGNEPDVMLHVIGAVPVAEGVCWYTVPTVPPGSVWKSSLAPVGAATIVSENCLVALPAEF